MKILFVLFLASASCCLASALSPCVSSCIQTCQANPSADPFCLQTALYSNFLGTVGALSDFLCAYDRYMNTADASGIKSAIQSLSNLPGCRYENFLGKHRSVQTADASGILQNLAQTFVKYLSVISRPNLNVQDCGPLNPLLTKMAASLNFNLGVPQLGVPVTQPPQKPGLLDGLLQTVSQLLQNILGGNTLGLLENNKGLPKNNFLGGLLGGNGIVSELTSPVGKLTSGLVGKNGPINGLTGLTGNLLNQVGTDSIVQELLDKNGVVSRLTSSLLDKNGLLAGLPMVGQLTPNVLNLIRGSQDGTGLLDNKGLIAGLTSTVSNLPSSLLDKNGLNLPLVGSLTSTLNLGGGSQGASDNIVEGLLGNSGLGGLTDTLNQLTSDLLGNTGLLNGLLETGNTAGSAGGTAGSSNVALSGGTGVSSGSTWGNVGPSFTANAQYNMDTSGGLLGK